MRRKRNRSYLTCATTLVLFICLSANAAILQVTDLQITCPGSFYSYASGAGSMSINRAVMGLLKTKNATAYDYDIISATLSISSPLVHDISSGGYAKGLFAGGRTMILTGSIKNKATNEIIYTGTIFNALMQIDAASTWQLIESPSTAIDGGVDFNPNTAVGLGSGISYGNDVLKLGSFRADFAFKGLQPNPTKFAVSQTLIGLASTIQFTAIPEPASMLFFAAAISVLRFGKR